MRRSPQHPGDGFAGGIHESAPPSDPPERARVSRSALLASAPALLFLLAAGLSFLFSVFLWFRVDREQGLFVGLWVPSILALGALILAAQRKS